MNSYRCAFTFSWLLILTACQPEEISIAEPKLDYYIDSFNTADSGFQPQTKVSYEYHASGVLDKYTVSSYSTGAGSPIVQHYFVFSYDNNKVQHIKGYLPDSSSPYIEYSYQYISDSGVSKITENNHASGISSEANFSYDQSNETVKVSYLFSNGGSFEYEYNYKSRNILSDKTTKGTQVCSDGAYTYDQHINPFRNLGYVDYLLTNLSANNKLTENINYTGCSFPSLVPESYSYAYDERGYPILATTTYKGNNATKSQKKIFYK